MCNCCPYLIGEVAGVGSFDLAACLGKEVGHEYKNIMFDIRDTSDVLLECELSGSVAASFYADWNRVKGGVVVCVFWWAAVDFYRGKTTICETSPTRVMLNPPIPEVDEFMSRLGKKKSLRCSSRIVGGV
ncbi:unnamed protein product [Microthlaspi erraticum]|uniref:Uncharacterized protein n=1 Tax=Microthlaspi erraticum TaxID=1685480 RepID=A0A6D2JT43_9BRAS|nr:unnamed protein product [Microthlaspi erraticum]